MTEYVVPEEKLQQLLFWASVGVRKSRGGSHQESIAEVINETALALGYELGEYAPVFGADLEVL